MLTSRAPFLCAKVSLRLLTCTVSHAEDTTSIRSTFLTQISSRSSWSWEHCFSCRLLKVYYVCVSFSNTSSCWTAITVLRCSLPLFTSLNYTCMHYYYFLYTYILNLGNYILADFYSWIGKKWHLFLAWYHWTCFLWRWMQNRLRFMGTSDFRSLKRLKALHKYALLLYQESLGANCWNNL